RVIQFIGVGAQRCLATDMTEDPFFLKPREVANLPKQGVDDRQTRAEELIVGKVSHQSEGPLASVLNPGGEFSRRGQLFVPRPHRAKHRVLGEQRQGIASGEAGGELTVAEFARTWAGVPERWRIRLPRGPFTTGTILVRNTHPSRRWRR